MTHHKIFLTVFGLLFAAMTVLFVFFPRSTFSHTERRELKKFPEFTTESLQSGEYARAIGEWFSDTGPFRDEFMTASMTVRQLAGWRSNDADAITIHEDNSAVSPENVSPEDNGHIDRFEVRNGADEKAKIASRGIIVVGAAPTARALMIYGGIGGGDSFARAANEYKKAFGDKVNIYVMVIPNSTEYYLPEQVKNKSKSMYATVVSVHEKLDPGVKPVDVYTILGQHAAEDIFLRTDHHWAPLGAFYAAKKFAETAHVPFRELSAYDRHVVHGFVGTMYGYSNDIAIKNSPEDFVYYTPKGIDYQTTYINYTLDDDFNITHASAPRKGQFFFKYKDGSGAAYSTFMGGDMKITKVETGTHNGRRLVIIKDSFGNALPGYLFYSFEQIHVIDSRYFDRNLREYIRTNGITDILLAANVFRVYSPASGKGLMDFLNGNNMRHKNGPSKTVQKTEPVTVQKTEENTKPAAAPASDPEPQSVSTPNEED